MFKDVNGKAKTLSLIFVYPFKCCYISVICILTKTIVLEISLTLSDLFQSLVRSIVYSLVHFLLILHIQFIVIFSQRKSVFCILLIFVIRNIEY